MAERVNIVDECRYCGKNCIGQVCKKCWDKVETVKKFVLVAGKLKEDLEARELAARRLVASETVAKYGHKAICMAKESKRRR